MKKARRKDTVISLKSRSQVEADALQETRPPLERRKRTKREEDAEDDAEIWSEGEE